MLISEAFPSEFLKASDLQDRQVTVVMDHVELRDVGDKLKPVLFFRGKAKGLVLNKVNSNNIAIVYGDETDGWAEQQLILYPTMVDMQGRSVPAIRVKAPKVQARQAPERTQWPAAEEFAPRNGAPRPGPKAGAMTSAQELQDEVPF